MTKTIGIVLCVAILICVGIIIGMCIFINFLTKSIDELYKINVSLVRYNGKLTNCYDEELERNNGKYYNVDKIVSEFSSKGKPE